MGEEHVHQGDEPECSERDQNASLLLKSERTVGHLLGEIQSTGNHNRSQRASPVSQDVHTEGT